MKHFVITALIFAAVGAGAAEAADARGGLQLRVPGFSQRAPVPPPILNPAALQADLRAKAGADTVYFSAQGYGLNAAAIATLRAQAAWLRANPAIMIRLDGHADQNDTRDYAFGIAERRAAGVRDFLITQGVAPDRMSIASWGKERPGTIRVGTSMVGVGPRVVTTIR